ncbi:MAG: hypothetical protein JWP40_3429 [Blastococcus sp.]|jgi:hypothetical protein|nr:hypothetical protein [Blastococcus sp.]
MNGDRLIRVSAALTVVGVAGVAAFVSYRHAYEVATAHGETGVTASLIPFTIDGLVFVASMVMLDSARRGQSSPTLAKWALALGIGSTVAVNVLHGIAHGPVGAVIAAWPAVTLVVVVELLMGMIRRGRVVLAEQVAEVADDRPAEVAVERVLSHPQTELSEAPDAGHGAVVSLDDAVMSARAAGMSVRAVSEAFGVTRYRVEKLDKQQETATGPAASAALNGQVMA